MEAREIYTDDQIEQIRQDYINIWGERPGGQVHGVCDGCGARLNQFVPAQHPLVQMAGSDDGLAMECPNCDEPCEMKLTSLPWADTSKAN